MAYIQANFVSQSLMRTVTINAILPADKISVPGLPDAANPPYKTLYLLHGITGNYTDWVNNSSIQRWADDNNLAVIMPSGENMFYLDQPVTNAFYAQFVGEELVNITRKMFPLSSKREDTFIAGLSMGGYGALRNGLKYHKTFSRIGAFSAALLIDDMPGYTDENPLFCFRKSYIESIFGEIESVADSDKNPMWILKKLLEKKEPVPEIYLACGTEDFLLPNNQRFYEAAHKAGADIVYETWTGNHEWDFWNEAVRRFLVRLPLNN